jgi:hypothetical protein
MVLVRELVVSLPYSGGAAEVVESHRVVPVLGETESELLVEIMKTANIGEDHDTRALALGARRGEGSELVAVRSGQDQILVPGSATLDRVDGRSGVIVVTHGHETTA